jgi:hypothetical protein
MRTNCFINLCILLLALTGCGNEVENETVPRESFPDLLFELYIRENFDSNGDGEISLGEAKAVRDIDCSDMRITSLKGIEHFTGLETLNCSGNSINAIDLIRNTALRSLTCNSCEIESVDLSKNVALEYLYCSGNYNLKSLDLSGNTNIRELYCDDNQNLASLNPGDNANLRTLSCNRNATLPSLELSGVTNLRELSCISDNNMTITGLTGFRLLEKLVLRKVAIETISIGGSPLKEFDCEIAVRSSLSIDLAGCDRLELFRLSCTYDGMTTMLRDQSLNLAGCSALKTVEISGITFKSFDVSSFVSLQKLEYPEEDVDISGNTELEEVNVRDILGDITGLRKLRKLTFRWIKNVPALDLGNQTALEYLHCAVLDIPTDLSRCKALRTFTIYNQFFDNPDAIKIAAVNLKDLPVLDRVTTGYLENKVSLNIENCPALKMITGHRLATLNVVGCASLEELDFTCNAFNLERCPNVIVLACGAPLGTLRFLDALTKLERLYCVNCSLTELDLRKNKSVNTLICHDNPDLKYIELIRGHEIPHKSIGSASLRYWDE